MRNVAFVVLAALAFGPDSAMGGVAGARLNTDMSAVTLENGLRLIILENPDARTVEIEQVHGVGPAQEPAGKEGIAHLLEHLMSDSWDSDPTATCLLELYTLYRNAYTSLASTWYESFCLPQFLPEVLRLEAMRLKQFAPTPAVFEREKFVVREELALRDSQSPQRDLDHAVLQAAYPDHPYGRPIAGTDSTVASISLEDLQEFYARSISPENTTVVVHGAVRRADVLAQMNDVYGSIPPNPLFAAVVRPPPAERKRATCVIDRHDAENLHARIGFRLPARSKEELLMGLLVCQLLSPDGSRGHWILLPGEWFFSVGGVWLYPSDLEDVNPDLVRRDAWQSLWEDLDVRKREATRPDSFEVYRERALERMRSTTSLTGLLGSMLLFEGDISWFAERDSILRGFDLDEVKTYVDRWIHVDNSSSGVAHGRLSRRPVALELSSLTRGSDFGAQVSDPRSALTASEITPILAAILQAPRSSIARRNLANGIPLYVISHPDGDDVRLGGTKTLRYVKHSEKKHGLLRLYNFVLNADPQPGSRVWKPLPQGVRFDATPQSLTFSGRGSANKIDQTAAALVERMRKREFNVATWRLLRENASYYLTPKRVWPDLEARVQSWSALLGPDHPALNSWRGDPHQTPKWKYDHLQDIHADLMKTGNLMLFATGSIDPDTLAVSLNRTFGQLKPLRERDKWVCSEATLQAPYMTVISAFDRRDSHIVFTFLPLHHRAHSQLDWASIKVLRACIRSQVYSRLRYREGLSYTVFGEVERAGDSMIMELHASTFAPASKRAIASMYEELQQLAQFGIDENLLARAKLQVSADLFRSLDDPGDAFATLREMSFFGALPDDPLQAVSTVELARINSLLRSSLDVGRLIVSVCGPILEEEAGTLRQTIRAQR